ncbi:putative surface layer protein [Candidatus Methanomassiliicoccus intestinalis Issoire-Mx1]|uniref:Putative surface layer protein n=2 Tax=Candidatus Methanomassiliicoccus intestinalis TaxID=1406512 RepID=R9T776_METII|nr:hypothetical protein [Candidatus Methanomassiliicoccus intestinalis]AGN26504.1 putative surface layer protein [Candidatus Methanomassiliicoccus intestinalis Issoire-Mx1]
MSENNEVTVSNLTDLKNALGGNIKLAQDITISNESGPLTLINGTILDLNGHTITIPSVGNESNKNDTSNSNIDSNSNRLVIADNATVTIKDGKIVYSGTLGDISPIRVGQTKTSVTDANVQTLNLNNVDIISNGYGVAVFSKGVLNITGGSITADSSAVATNGGNPVENGTTNSADAKITLNGGCYTSTTTAAIYFPGGAELNVTGGTFTGKTGFDIRSGTVTIDDNAIINVLGSPDEKKTDDDGPTPWGMGVAVFDNTAYGKNTDDNDSVTQTPINVTVNSANIYNAAYAYYFTSFGSYDDLRIEGGSFNTSQQTIPSASHNVSISIPGNGNSFVNLSKGATVTPTKLQADGTDNSQKHPITIETIGIDNFIFANGTPISIGSGSLSDSKIEYKDNSGNTILFVDNFDLSTFTVFGGSNNAGETVTSSEITMNGGKAYGIVGGGYGNATVGTSTITIDGGKATYVAGGGWSTDSSTTAVSLEALKNKTTTTNVTINGGDILYAVGGGRLGYTHVETANLTINGGNFDEIVAGGINGYTKTANLTVNGTSKITTGLISSGNRGQVSNVTVDIKSLGTEGSANIVVIGALSGFTSTDGGPNAIFDNITFKITEDINGIDKIFLGGAKWSKGSNPWITSRINSLSDTTITIDAPGYTVSAADISNANDYTNITVQASDYTIGDGKTWTLTESSKLEIIEGSSLTTNGSGKFINEGIIEVNSADALKNAINLCSGTIKLMDNINVVNSVDVNVEEGYTTSLLISNNVTLDLNGHTLTLSSAGSGIYVGAGGYLTIMDSSNSKGSIIYTYSDMSNATIMVNGTSPDYAQLVLEKCNIFVVNTTGAYDAGYGVFASTYSKVSSDKDVSITAGYSAISGNGTDNGAEITISGGKYTSNASAAIFFPSTTNLTVTGGKFIGKTGFDIRAGTVSISNAEISINQNEPIDSTGASGPSSWGMGVAVIDHPNYGSVGTTGNKSYSDISVTISKTAVTGAKYDLYVGDLNRGKNGEFLGTDGTFTANHSIEVEVNGSTVYTVAADDTNAERFTSTIKSSSGGSSGGYPVNPPVTPDTPEEPIIPDSSGNAEIKVDDKKADELVHETVASGSNTLSIVDKDNVEGTVTSVSISVSDLETISKKIENNNNIDSISIATSEGEVIIEKEVLAEILENNSEADTLIIEVNNAENKLTEEQKKVVGDNPVYDITIRAGNENISSFNGKSITVSIPYELKEGEDQNNLIVYYLKDDGSIEKMNCSYKDNQVSFETNHLSKFIIVYEAQEPIVPDNPDDKNDDNNSDNTVYYIIAAVIIILIIIALAYYFMKKK